MKFIPFVIRNNICQCLISFFVISIFYLIHFNFLFKNTLINLINFQYFTLLDAKNFILNIIILIFKNDNILLELSIILILFNKNNLFLIFKNIF